MRNNYLVNLKYNYLCIYIIMATFGSGWTKTTPFVFIKVEDEQKDENGQIIIPKK